MHKYPYLYKSVVYKHTKYIYMEINKHLHTKHGKNTCTQNYAHMHMQTHTEDCTHMMPTTKDYAVIYSVIFQVHSMF